MSLQARKEMLTSIQEKYHSSDWKLKNKLLDGFVAAIGYERKHAIKLLNTNILNPVEALKKREKAGRHLIIQYKTSTIYKL